MNVLQATVAIIQALLLFAFGTAALLGLLLIIIARLPSDNPLKRILAALSLRVGAVAAAGIVAIPIEPIPVLDVLYDVAVPAALLYFWLTLFREVTAILRGSRRPRGAAAGAVLPHREFAQVEIETVDRPLAQPERKELPRLTQ